MNTPFPDEVSRELWATRYRAKRPDGRLEPDIRASWDRLASALSEPEPRDVVLWKQRFRQTLADFRFLPGGRILAGAGTNRPITLFNCFVMDGPGDSPEGIFDALREGFVTMQQGGGVGYDFSGLPPRGMEGADLPAGPVEYMRIWDTMCSTVSSAGNRRGAMMATLRCDHPDILEFIDAKRSGRGLTNFNLSVQVSDAFLEAVRADRDWPLVFPAGGEDSGPFTRRTWTGASGPVKCRVHREIRARDLWQRMAFAAHACGDPGALFVDAVNRDNNLAYAEHITATNPCGEIPLPPYGACNLGSINLPEFVRRPFTDRAEIDLGAIRETTGVAVRMLDNALDLSRYPLPDQARVARNNRRIGLGITGLGDALIMLGLHYGEEAARQHAARIMRDIAHAAYRTSIGLAREKGAFPSLDPEKHLAAPFVKRLPGDIRDGIRDHGIRNSHLLAVAPAGTISLLAGNISSGMEPVYAFHQKRRLVGGDGRIQTRTLTNPAWRTWQSMKPDRESLPRAFVTAYELEPDSHLAMQAALQPYVDNAISKTVNLPPESTPADFARLLDRAAELDLKGVTLFRAITAEQSVLFDADDPACSGIECAAP